MKKWIGLYAAVSLIILIGISSVVGIRAADEAVFGVIHNENGYVSQIIQSEDHGYVLYQNPETSKFKIADTTKEMEDYQTVGTVHKERVYVLFQCVKDGVPVLGIEPVVPENEEEWETPVFDTEGMFLAAGSTDNEILVSVLEQDGKTITEYSISFSSEESVWQERSSFQLTEGHYIICAAYDENVFFFELEDGRQFQRDVVVKEMNTEIEDTVLANAQDGKVISGGETTWKAYSIVCSMGKSTIPALIVAMLIVMLLYATRKKEPMFYRALCYTEVSSISGFIVIGYIFSFLLIRNEALTAEVKEEAVLVVRNIIFVLMFLVTLVHGIVFLAFSSGWKKFVKGMQYVATEKKPYTEIPSGNDGLQMIWSSLDTIGQNMSRLEYERDVLYRSYFRFVPKGMERFLKKTEVADIKIGDHSMVEGCMVHFSLENVKDFDDSQYMSIMTDSLRLMHKVREKHGGVFLSAGADLLERKIFFEKNSGGALPFVVDLIHAYAEHGSLQNVDYIFLLHLSNYYYGISGVKDMMTPFMFCKEEKLLEPYIPALAKAKVKIVLTERTLSLIGNRFSVRYIGFISDEEMGKIKLYECLDAYKERRQKKMEETDGIFQNAIQLFYSNDFYLARNVFNEVLKLNEQDQIARWYLFRCEHHLNHPDAVITYGLFQNRIYDSF